MAEARGYSEDDIAKMIFKAMNNTIPIKILQATSVIKDYADIQEKLIKEFEN